MDTRFPPPLKKVRVPLYPGKAKLDLSLLFQQEEPPLRSFLAKYYRVSEEQIFLFARGAMALSFFLGCIRTEIASMRVALPAFCCPDVCHAVLSAGGSPVFLEMDPELSLSEESVRFAKAQGCQILVWPHLFGTRRISESALACIREAGLVFVSDEAQSFPELGENALIRADANLFSFGPSKKLAGIGGGGICIANAKRAASFALEKNEISCLNYVKNAIIARVQLWRPRLALRMGISPYREKDLRQLLEKRPFFSSPLSLQAIAPLQARAAYLQLQNYQKAAGRFLKDLNAVKKLCGDVFGAHSLRWVDGVLYPSILALDLSQTQKTRGEIFRFFSARGVQTTWYYFPLNQLSFLQQYRSEPTPFSEKIAAGILILPFQWAHSEREREIFIASLRDLV